MIRAVEMGEQGVGLFAAKAGDGGDFLGWRGRDALDRAKGNEQGLALLRANAGDVVQGGTERAFGALLAVVFEREAMGFVAQHLQQAQAGRGLGQQQGVALVRQDDFLKALGEADDGLVCDV